MAGNKRGVTGFSPDKLRAARTAKMEITPTGEFTQKDVANRLGIEWTNYLLYERRKDAPSPTPARLRKIADLLGIEPSSLIDLDGEPTLAHLREWSGNTQTDVARHLSGDGYTITQGTYSRVENGDASLPHSAVVSLAALIGVKPENVSALINRPSLRQLRRWAGFTVDQVEQALITRGDPGGQLYYDVEAGTVRPTEATVSILSDLFGVDKTVIDTDLR